MVVLYLIGCPLPGTRLAACRQWCKQGGNCEKWWPAKDNPSHEDLQRGTNSAARGEPKLIVVSLYDGSGKECNSLFSCIARRIIMPNFSVDDLVLGLQGFAAIATLTLRSPQHVTKAVDAGALDLAAELMAAHPDAPYMLRQACQMIRNLNVRNPENRYELLEPIYFGHVLT
jgi:hypothetical protein